MSKDFWETVHHITGIANDFSGVLGPLIGVIFATRLARLQADGARASKHLRIGAVLLAVMAAVSILFIALRSSDAKAGVVNFLTKRDPELFRSANTENLQIARVFTTRAELASQTDMKSTLSKANKSFDLMAVTGSAMLTEFRADVLDAIRRGVLVRFLFLNPEQSNRVNFELHAQFALMQPDQMMQMATGYKATLREVIARVRADKRTYRGDLQVRYVSKPLVTSGWIRDAREPDAIAHIELRLHSRYPDWPSFRVAADGGRLIEVLRSDFDGLWNGSKDL